LWAGTLVVFRSTAQPKMLPEARPKPGAVKPVNKNKSVKSKEKRE
jgi:hypothetical protein